jgi:hypothetical protein
VVVLVVVVVAKAVQLVVLVQLIKEIMGALVQKMPISQVAEVEGLV